MRRRRQPNLALGPPRPTRLRRIIRLYRYLPTCLTLGNSLCGFGAILLTLRVYANVYGIEKGHGVAEILATSAWLVCGAMIFDLLDGWTARMLNAMSMHGMQMDSLADMVTFGVAPAVMVAVMADVNEVTMPYQLVWILSAGYLACVALRLALYNVLALTQEGHSDEFHGLPSPGAAAAVCSLIILSRSDEFGFALLAQLLPLYAGLLGLLMVSPIPYPHIGHWLGSRRKWQFKVLGLIAFALLFAWSPHVVAAVLINGYVISGPLHAIIAWIRTHPLDHEHDHVVEHDADDGDATS